MAVLAMLGAGAVLAVPALGHQSGPARNARRAAATVASGASDSGLANLPLKTAKMSCSSLARGTHVVNGLKVQIAEHNVGHATGGGPQYCALSGHIAKYIGFEVLLPTKTWHQRYLQIGCGGLCGSIGLNAPQSTDFKALAAGWFVVASDDEGHSGMSNSWYSNPVQRVDFAYLSDHDLALVAQGLAARFYGVKPTYSYFDGCSQGGHEALTEAERFPKDFNGILAGSPANIMTELNSELHEYEDDSNVSSTDTPIVTESEALIVQNAALKLCDPKVGLMLDYRGCEEKFNIDSVECTATQTTNCLTAAQIAEMNAIHNGPVDPQGQHLFPGGYPLGSEWGLNLPTTASQTVTRDDGTGITSWLRYYAFEKDIGAQSVENEPFTKAYFEKLEKLAPYWDDTDPYLGPFEKAGGKLILWAGEADWSIPTVSSIADYQAIVKAMGGIAAAQKFTRYYLLPSVGHCGTGAPDTYSGLADVVRWTEKGKAPNAIQANEYQSSLPSGHFGPPPGGGGAPTTDLTDAIPTLGAPAVGPVLRSIELFPYPELPAYKGHGSVNVASSFEGKVSKALEAPTPWLGKMDNVMIWCNAKGVACKKRLMPTS
ncbi:MAG TPA: tannase/feruloyl esterase family alpha/beta hydrolase [Solirubrobacteraceae bacterium]|nr:tannase/feruloyl esterase family alpha/beta hydrolase [Solirubrobacteraceae bacterium]